MPEKKSHPDDDVDIFGEKDGGGSSGKLFAEVQPSGVSQSKSQIFKNDMFCGSVCQSVALFLQISKMYVCDIMYLLSPHLACD